MFDWLDPVSDGDSPGAVIGFDRERAFYPTVLIVIASYLCIVRRNGSFWALVAH